MQKYIYEELKKELMNAMVKRAALIVEAANGYREKGDLEGLNSFIETLERENESIKMALQIEKGE